MRQRLAMLGLTDPTDTEVSFITAMYDQRVPARTVWKDPVVSAIAGRAGRGKAKDVWFELINPCNAALHCYDDIERSKAAGIETVKFRVSDIAVGPCQAALECREALVPISSAQILPLPSCDRQDQCGCRYQSWIPLMDEMGP